MENAKEGASGIGGLAGESVADWVGREVAVAYLSNGERKRFACTLLGADALGLGAAYEQDGCHLKRFIPLGAVEYVHLLDDEALRWRRKKDGRGPVGFSS